MSKKGDCWDNAVAESFFASLKKEYVHNTNFKTRAQAQLEVFDYIEAWYNNERSHSTLNGLSLNEFEEINKDKFINFSKKVVIRKIVKKYCKGITVLTDVSGKMLAFQYSIKWSPYQEFWSQQLAEIEAIDLRFLRSCESHDVTFKHVFRTCSQV